VQAIADRLGSASSEIDRALQRCERSRLRCGILHVTDFVCGENDARAAGIVVEHSRRIDQINTPRATREIRKAASRMATGFMLPDSGS
jgi:hypothetical protein